MGKVLVERKRARLRKPCERCSEACRAKQVVLVFQGGGALGAYQAGVYQALHEARIEPDWIIGTSIGAINAALIAGNAPENRIARLEEFWRRTTRKQTWSLSSWPGVSEAMSNWSTLFGGISGFFRPNPLAFFGAHVGSAPRMRGSTRPLRWKRRSTNWSISP